MAKAPGAVRTTRKRSGIPRTHGVAKELGYASVNVEFSDLEDHVKAGFVQLADHGARAGSLCGVGPSPDTTFWLVCYKDENGRCSWMHVPRGAPVQSHG